jgi:hypothetical protein
MNALFPTAPRALSRGDAAPQTSLARAIVAHARAAFTADHAINIAKRSWPRDHVTAAIITRGATSPARTDTPAWAEELARKVISDLISVLGPSSAASSLMDRGIKLDLGSYLSLFVPGVAFSTKTTFVGEGLPIPIVDSTVYGITLGVHKIGTVFALSRDMGRRQQCRAARQRDVARERRRDARQCHVLCRSGNGNSTSWNFKWRHPDCSSACWL